MSFTAQYPGVCAECDERFPAGAEIEYDSDGDLVHVDCPARIPAFEPRICGSCFMSIPAGRSKCPECHPEEA